MSEKKSLRHHLGISYFIHPVPLSAVSLLIINDHYLKTHYHNWWTGKLSDFCGVFFLPIFTCAVYCLALNIWHKIKNDSNFEWISSKKIFIGILLTDFILIALKLWPAANTIYFSIMQILGIPVIVVADATDLIALTMNWPTYIFARQFWIN